MENKLFSVLIANYNNGHFIGACLDSLLRQCYDSIEVVIVDDCSRDNSLSVIESYKDKFKNFVFIVNDKNRGAGYTKKRCIDHASGYVCGFIDPDDALEKNAITIMMNQHDIYPKSSLIYSTNYECDAQLKVLSKNTWIKQQPTDTPAYRKTFIGHFATFKTQMYQQTEGMNPLFRRAVDHDLYYLMADVGEVVFIDQPLYYYRNHSGGISLKDNQYKAEYWDWVVKSHHAQKHEEHLEQEYDRVMRTRLSADGLVGRFLIKFYQLYKSIFHK